jgi:putative MATE family efflux protein
MVFDFYMSSYCFLTYMHSFFILVVVAEGAFRGNDDSKTPLIASGIAALFNLILDPIFMFPLGMGMAGAAAATAVSQLGAAGVYAWRIWKRKLLPQPKDPVFSAKSSRSVVKSILGANLAMLAKQGSMLVFYTMATALATRMGPAHVATHQVALSLFWLVTYWLDSGSVAAQVLMGKQLGEPKFARSLTKYMLKYALVQGLALSALVAGVGKLVPGMFTQDATIQSLLMQCLPHLAMQQTLVSFTLVLEGLALGGKQFRYMAAGTAAATAAGVYQLTQATDVVGIWATAVNTFFVGRLLNGIVGVTLVHLGLRRQQQSEQQQQDSSTVPTTL